VDYCWPVAYLSAKTKSHFMRTTFLIFLVGLAAAGCAQRLTGVWNVTRYESQTPGQTSVVLQNIGTFTFLKKGEGEKNISYSVLGVTKEDKQPFTWSLRENEITLSGSSSEFAKTWIVVVNKKKFQQWKSTDGANQVQVLELTR
jgi:hypothetical protein